MPTYEITAPDGRMLELQGDSPPTEQELEQIFAQYGQAPAQDLSMREQINQGLLSIPGMPALTEFTSAVNRGAVGLADIPSKMAGNVMQLMGSEYRPPLLAEQPFIKEATTGQFMEPGLMQKAVRTGGEFVAPGVGMGQLIRGLAGRASATAPTLTENVLKAMSGAPAAEMTGAALAGAGTELGGAAGKEIGGERGEQIGRLAGGFALPMAGALIKELSGKLVTSGAKSLLQESAPTIDNLKSAARTVYKEIDDLGASVRPQGTGRLALELSSSMKKEGFHPTIHPKVAAAMKEFESIAGKPQSLSEIDNLRKIARAAARSTEPDEARLGSIMVNKIDDFMDSAGRAELTKSSTQIGAKYKDARQLWRRAKATETIQDAFERAGLQATGFENGVRVQFRSILNSKKKSAGFTSEELDAMRQVVKGTGLQNMAKMLGRFGFSEGQASNMLMGSLGVAGGAAVGGAPGAVAVPMLGQFSRNLAQKLTRKSAEGVDLMIRAGSSGPEVVKAYMRMTPAKERSAQELTELLLRPDISLEGMKQILKQSTAAQKKLIQDAVYLTTTIKEAEKETQ